MKIIDETVSKTGYKKKDIIIMFCPSEFGFKDAETTRLCYEYRCEECWNREVEE